MVTARMMAIAAGYEDADDLDALRHDPALMIACNRAPEGGHDIPSQPTISRLENLADVEVALPHRHRLHRPVLPQLRDAAAIDRARHRRHRRSRARRPAARAVQHARRRPLLPADPHLRGQLRQADPVAACGRASGRPARRSRACCGTSSIASAGTGRRCDILVRGDSHYCAPEVLDLLRRLRCDYILGLSINPKLDAMAEPWRRAMRRALAAGPARRCAASISSSTQPARGRASEKVIARVEATELGQRRPLRRHQPRRAAPRSSTRRSTARADAWRT